MINEDILEKEYFGTDYFIHLFICQILFVLVGFMAHQHSMGHIAPENALERVD